MPPYAAPAAGPTGTRRVATKPLQVNAMPATKPATKPAMTTDRLNAAMAARPRINANARVAPQAAAAGSLTGAGGMPPAGDPALPPRLQALSVRDPAAAQTRYAAFLAAKDGGALGMPGTMPPPSVGPLATFDGGATTDLSTAPVPPPPVAGPQMPPPGGAMMGGPGMGGMPNLPPEILQRLMALRGAQGGAAGTMTSVGMPGAAGGAGAPGASPPWAFPDFFRGPQPTTAYSSA